MHVTLCVWDPRLKVLDFFLRQLSHVWIIALGHGFGLFQAFAHGNELTRSLDEGRARVETELALGATKWEVMRKVVLPAARPGIMTGAILAVARFVASLDGATRPVAAGAPLVLTLIASGGLGLCLGRSLLRPLGACLVLAGVAHWFAVDTRPLVLVAPEARLIGVMGPSGRRLDHATSASYAARVWLQRDGDPAGQKAAARRGGFSPGYRGSETVLPNGWLVLNVLDRRPVPARLEAVCQKQVVVLAPYANQRPEGECRFMGRRRLLRSGALSIDLEGDALRIRTAARRAGDRFWTGRALAEDIATVGLE